MEHFKAFPTPQDAAFEIKEQNLWDSVGLEYEDLYKLVLIDACYDPTTDPLISHERDIVPCLSGVTFDSPVPADVRVPIPTPEEHAASVVAAANARVVRLAHAATLAAKAAVKAGFDVTPSRARQAELSPISGKEDAEDAEEAEKRRSEFESFPNRRSARNSRAVAGKPQFPSSGEEPHLQLDLGKGSIVAYGGPDVESDASSGSSSSDEETPAYTAAPKFDIKQATFQKGAIVDELTLLQSLRQTGQGGPNG